MKKAITMGFLSFLLGCSDGRPSGMSEDDIRRAALRIVSPLPTCSKSWIGGTVEQCDSAMSKVTERRKEFATFDPPWMRTAIMHWFDFAEREITEAREDCATQASRKDLDAARERWRKEDERRDAILRSIGRK